LFVEDQEFLICDSDNDDMCGKMLSRKEFIEKTGVNDAMNYSDNVEYWEAPVLAIFNTLSIESHKDVKVNRLIGNLEEELKSKKYDLLYFNPCEHAGTVIWVETYCEECKCHEFIYVSGD
jgi:hypothetical protein